MNKNINSLIKLSVFVATVSAVGLGIVANTTKEDVKIAKEVLKDTQTEVFCKVYDLKIKNRASKVLEYQPVNNDLALRASKEVVDLCLDSYNTCSTNDKTKHLDSFQEDSYCAKNQKIDEDLKELDQKQAKES